MSAVRLGDHAKLIRGITFKPADKCDPSDEGAVACMRTKNVQVTLDASDLIAVPSSLVKNPEKMLSAGDILVSSANSWNLVGKCCQVRKLPYPSTAGGFISILRPKTKKLKSSYLYRWFSSDVVQRKLRSFANQTTNISNLDHKRTLELQIPLPSPAEQKRIAGILDAADALRTKRREALAQLDTLLQSTFLDMFGDPVTNPMELRRETLKSAFEFTTGKLDSNAAVERGKYPFFTCARETSAIDEYAFDCEALLLAGNNASADYSVKHYKGRFNAYQRTYVITIKGSALTYPYARMVLDYLLGDLKRFSKGTNTKYLTMVILNRMPILVPPLYLQRRFAAVVESIEEQKARQHAHLAELDTLFASLQSRAFRGDL